MTYSKLVYSRALAKEEKAVVHVSKEEYQKQHRNQKKIDLLKNNLKEIRAERKKVCSEIRDWLEKADMPCDIKEQVVKYYLQNGEFYDDNFFRYVKRSIGEK